MSLELRRDGGEPVEEAVRDHRGARLGVADQVAQHLAEVAVVRRHLDCAQPGEAEPDEIGLERVRHHRDDVLARLHAEAAQRRGPAELLGRQLGIGHHPPGDVLHRRPVGCRVGAAGDQVGQDEITIEHPGPPRCGRQRPVKTGGRLATNAAAASA
jgi:hypothetical protein